MQKKKRNLFYNVSSMHHQLYKHASHRMHLFLPQFYGPDQMQRFISIYNFEKAIVNGSMDTIHLFIQTRV